VGEDCRYHHYLCFPFSRDVDVSFSTILLRELIAYSLLHHLLIFVAEMREKEFLVELGLDEG
jgi:hypothetical protein